MRYRRIILCLALFLNPGPGALAGGTVVGNGGDPIFEFLEAARSSMVETLKILANDPKERESFCQKSSLSPEQTAFCREYFVSVTSDILRLSQGKEKTLFVLREEPLLVMGPDGKPMMVAARTALGPRGPIEFHRDSVKVLPPAQVLFLITHEFQHKANFRGAFITDNGAIGPFATGRDLMDAAASSVVGLARKKGQIGSQFGIRDIFDCRVTANGAHFGARLSSSRFFLADDLMSYETSVGKNPTDGSVYLPESANSSLLLKVSISEPNNCGDPHPLRKTLVQMVRATKLPDGSTQETVLTAYESADNPICPGSNNRLEIFANRVKFSCQYFGSEGTTSSPFSWARWKRPLP